MKEGRKREREREEREREKRLLFVRTRVFKERKTVHPLGPYVRIPPGGFRRIGREERVEKEREEEKERERHILLM